MIHDEWVAHHLWPGSEPVRSDEYRDIALLDSAVNRPFHSFGGQDCYPSLHSKAAALFHSLACNHCFHNGNKRTALIALDLFLTANSACLLANNDEVYELAKSTASHNERGQPADAALAEVLAFIKENTVSFRNLEAAVRRYRGEQQESMRRFVRGVKLDRTRIRRHPLNAPSAALDGLSS
jgi:death-on-curing family protein